MTKQRLYRVFDRVGLCTVNGYDEEGFVGSWSIRTTRDIDRLPGSLLYEVAK